MILLINQNKSPKRTESLFQAIPQNGSQLLQGEVYITASLQEKYIRTNMAIVTTQEYRQRFIVLLTLQNQTPMLVGTELPFIATIASQLRLSRLLKSKRPA